MRPSELEWVNAQYREIRFKPSGPDDFVAIAEVGGCKAGMGRLVRIDQNTAELGGIYVLPAHRGQHLARNLISYLLGLSPYPSLYCIPFAHLAKFYRSFGFQEAKAGQRIPEAVESKFRWCTAQYSQPVALLVRGR